jgi:hypothetical protein
MQLHCMHSDDKSLIGPFLSVSWSVFSSFQGGNEATKRRVQLVEVQLP